MLELLQVSKVSQSNFLILIPRDLLLSMGIYSDKFLNTVYLLCESIKIQNCCKQHISACYVKGTCYILYTVFTLTKFE